MADDSSPPPDGAQDSTCRFCGAPLWWVQADPGTGLRFLLLEPFEWPAPGGVVLSGGVASFAGPYGQGLYQMHKCPERVTQCRDCREPVLVLNQPPGSAEMLAVLDADRDPAGGVTISREGWAVRDPGHRQPGPWYRWHPKHPRNG